MNDGMNVLRKMALAFMAAGFGIWAACSTGTGTESTTGEAGNWTLDTGATAMEPCGYVIRLVGCDRTIWNSGSVGLCAAEDVGFCLEEAPEP